MHRKMTFSQPPESMELKLLGLNWTEVKLSLNRTAMCWQGWVNSVVAGVKGKKKSQSCDQIVLLSDSFSLKLGIIIEKKMYLWPIEFSSDAQSHQLCLTLQMGEGRSWTWRSPVKQEELSPSSCPPQHGGWLPAAVLQEGGCPLPMEAFGDQVLSDFRWSLPASSSLLNFLSLQWGEIPWFQQHRDNRHYSITAIAPFFFFFFAWDICLMLHLWYIGTSPLISKVDTRLRIIMYYYKSVMKPSLRKSTLMI